MLFVTTYHAWVSLNHSYVMLRIGKRYFYCYLLLAATTTYYTWPRKRCRQNPLEFYCFLPLIVFVLFASLLERNGRAGWVQDWTALWRHFFITASSSSSSSLSLGFLDGMAASEKEKGDMERDESLLWTLLHIEYGCSFGSASVGRASTIGSLFFLFLSYCN